MAPPQVTIPGSASAQRLQFAGAYSILERAIAEQAFPGAVFGVLAQGAVLALDGVGGFTYDLPAEPVTASTVFDLASVTKVIATTSMAMLLYQSGQLSLDQPLARILPAFAEGEAAGGARHRVTLRMLLAHASGLPGYVRLFEECEGREALLHACLRLPLESVARKPRRVLRSRIHSVGRGARSPCRRAAGRLLRTRSIRSPVYDEHLLSTAR